MSNGSGSNRPDDERLEAISQALARLVRRQDETEERLRRIEAALEIHRAPPQIPVVPPVPPTFPTPPPLPPPIPLQPPPVPKKPSVTLETLIGLNWVNIIGVVTLIFAAAFIFKYAVDNNWIGPGARVAMGVIAALLALFFGDRMWTHGQKVFGQGITGLGLALLYLSFWAAFGLYHLLPQPLCFVLMVATTAAAVVFAMRYESQTIAVIGMLAGYWVPGALSSGDPHPWILFSYVFLLNLGALALTRLRRWVAMEYLAAAATALWYLAWMANAFHDSDRMVATVFAFAFYAQFCAARTRSLWLAAQFLGPVAVLAAWERSEQFLPLLLAFAIGGLAIAAIRQWTEAPSWTLACFWGPFFFWQFVAFHPAWAQTRFLYLTAAFTLFFLWAPWWKIVRARQLRNTDLIVIAANAAAYFGAAYSLLNPDYHAYMGLLAAAVAALHLLLARLIFAEDDARPAQLALAVTVTFLTLAVPIQFSGFHITIAWALEGAALAWLSGRFGSLRMNIGATVVLLLVILRLFTIDAAIAHGRFLTFAVSAAALFASAKFFSDRAQALTAYVAGHFVALCGLGIELLAGIQRTVAKNSQFETGTVALSILMALYALMLVTIGVAAKSAINRMMGLILMALVVIKLYLVDVWELGFLFRIVAFLGLGILLLAVSYLYSRFRPMIEKLWKDDQNA